MVRGNIRGGRSGLRVGMRGNFNKKTSFSEYLGMKKFTFFMGTGLGNRNRNGFAEKKRRNMKFLKKLSETIQSFEDI